MDGHKLPFYRLSVAETLDELRTAAEGLGKSEATDRLKHIGPNVIHTVNHTPVWQAIARHGQNNPFVVLLLAGAACSLYLHQGTLTITLVAVACLNAAVGFWQERKKHHTTQHLARLAATHTNVLRRSKTKLVHNSQLVPGDIVYVQAGDSIPADCRVLGEQQLATDNFALTGIANPAHKFKHTITGEVPLDARHNMLYMGAVVTRGHGYGIVVATGIYTELGRIAALYTRTNAASSPLQQDMSALSVRLVQGALGIIVILLVINLQANLSLTTLLLFAISVIAAITPVGLLAAISGILAKAKSHLAHGGVLVTKPSAIDTLGATNIVFTNKSSALTKHELTVTRAIVGRTEYKVSGTGYELNGAVCTNRGKPIDGQSLQNLHLFFQTGALASNAEVNPPNHDNPAWHVVGDPVEGALITLARKAGLEPNSLTNQFPERKQYAFDSGRKRMTSVREVDGRLYAFTKGEPKAVMAHATNLWDHGHVRTFTDADRKFYNRYNDQHAITAQYTLAFAYRILPKGFNPIKDHLEDVEQNLIFLGVVSMDNPLRADVPAALHAAQQAHIDVSILTDNMAPTTAQDTSLPIPKPVINDADLTALSDEQVMQLLTSGGAVFSHVSLENRLRLVTIAQTGDHVVSITGTSTADIPSLKRADVGVALGGSGNSIAMDASEITLQDDNFATLVAAIEQGRTVVQNIRRAMRAALADSAAKLVVVLISFVGMVAWGIPAGLTIVQLLAIDLIALLPPLIALGWDATGSPPLRHAPRDPRSRTLGLGTLPGFLAYGALAAALAYANYLLFFARHHISPLDLGTHAGPYLAASILVFVTLVLCQFINLLLVRSGGQLFTRHLWSNQKLLAAFIISLFLVANIVHNPVVQPWFGSAALTGWDWLTAFVAAGLYTCVRMLHRHTRQHSARKLIKKHGAGKLRAHLQNT